MKSVFSKTKAIVLALILALSVCAFAACNPSGNEGGGGNGGGNGGNGGNGGTTTDKTVVQLIDEAQVIFNKAGKALSNATAGLAGNLTESQPQVQTLSAKSAPRIALLSDEKPSDGDDIPSAPTLDDLEGYVLLRNLQVAIKSVFGEVEYYTAEDFGGNENAPGIGKVKSEGTYTRLARTFKELDALLSEMGDGAKVTIENKDVPTAPSYAFKRDGNYVVSAPVLRWQINNEVDSEGKPILSEEEQIEVVARGETTYIAQGNTLNVTGPKYVQEGDKQLPDKLKDAGDGIDPLYRADNLSTFRSFTVNDNVASSSALEVVSADDDVYMRFYGIDMTSLQMGSEVDTNEFYLDLSVRWFEYTERMTFESPQGLENNWNFPNEVYGVAKFAPDGTSGMVKLFRNYSHDAGGPKDAAGNPQYERGTYPLPEKWLTSFNAETALDISGLEGNWLQHKQRYLCTFNFTGLPAAEEKK